jgi:hypothetical protein
MKSGFDGGFVGFALSGAAFGSVHLGKAPEIEMARKRGEPRPSLTKSSKRDGENELYI